MRGRVLLISLCALLVPAGTATAAPRDFYGVIPQEGLSANDYAALAEGDVGTVRVGFNWASFQFVEGQCEPEPQVGVCNWTGSDGLVASLAEAGVRVIPTFFGSPSFVNKNPTKPPVKGKDLKLWRSFVKSAAQRYGRGGTFWRDHEAYGGKVLPIKDWQVWNEQNSKQFWSPNPNPKKYGKLLKASAKSIRKGDRKANIVLGGMFADAKMPFVKFMNGLYRVKKAGRFFDEVAVHPYVPSIAGLKRQLRLARKGARGNTGIRVTEIGWSSDGGGHPLNKGKKGQAKMLRKSFGLLKRKRKSWNITGLNWFALRDTKNRATCEFCRKSGLFNVSGKPKPAWREFKKFSK